MEFVEEHDLQRNMPINFNNPFKLRKHHQLIEVNEHIAKQIKLYSLGIQGIELGIPGRT